MLKIILVFIVGFIEQLLYTSYLLSVTKKQVNASTILMVVYMSIYLFIISYAIKDGDTVPLLVAYALSCGVGNWCVMLWENRDKDDRRKKNNCRLFRESRECRDCTAPECKRRKNDMAMIGK
jgi:multidrug transporter EmrE-like cation transporter